MLRILTVLAAVLVASGAARADAPWSGTWATAWRDGGASLSLEQQGEHVYQSIGDLPPPLAAPPGLIPDAPFFTDVPTLSAERAAKHALFVDVVKLAEQCGVTLGIGMLTVDPAKEVAETWSAAGQ